MDIRSYFPVDGKKHSVQYESQDVSPEAYREIVSFCKSQYRYEFGSIVGSTWNDPDNEKYPGTLPKRISAWYYKNHAISVSVPHLKYIGDIASASLQKLTEFHFDFVEKFNWKDGDFGDPGSCVITTGRARWLQLWHGMAVRFFDGNRGVGRCWIMFPQDTDMYQIPGKDGGYKDSPKVKKAMSGSVAILCNAYNSGLGLNLSRIAGILKAFTKLKMSTCDMSITHSDVMYINGGTKYALSEEDLPDTKAFVTLNWDRHPVVICTMCGKKRKLMYDKGNKTWCEPCYSEVFGQCMGCTSSYEKDDMVPHHGQFLCQECAKKLKTCAYVGTNTMIGPLGPCGEREVEHLMRGITIFKEKGRNQETFICRKHAYRNCQFCGRYIDSFPCPHSRRDMQLAEEMARNRVTNAYMYASQGTTSTTTRGTASYTWRADFNEDDEQ